MAADEDADIETTSTRIVYENRGAAVLVGTAVQAVTGGVGFGFRIPARIIRARNRKFADSPLEESGFEPLVPLQKGQADVGDVAGQEKWGGK
jgi:hypothetical protein